MDDVADRDGYPRLDRYSTARWCLYYVGAVYVLTSLSTLPLPYWVRGWLFAGAILCGLLAGIVGLCVTGSALKGILKDPRDVSKDALAWALAGLVLTTTSFSSLGAAVALRGRPMLVSPCGTDMILRRQG